MLTQTTSAQVVITPASILETGLSFFSSKVLLTAVNLHLFTSLAESSKTGTQIKEALGLQERGLYDFLDALVALKFLYREGTGTEAKYCNTLETDVFLDKKKSSYVGGLLEMCNNRLFPFWNDLEEGLKTGLPQNEAKIHGAGIFEKLYEDESKLEEFMGAMTGVQRSNFIAFARSFDFSKYKTHVDIGGASGELSIQIATFNPGIHSTTYDLPPVARVAQRNIDASGVSDRVKTAVGNFFTDAFPKADLITMGNILHDWNLEEKKMLIGKAYDALPEGGAFIVIENIIDDERKENAFGLLMSLNMLIETPGGFDYAAKDFAGWAKEAGFKEITKIQLGGPASALVAYK
ncbi:methyltransferase [Danxiaibacter flavus]|uniref:Methyltransferase n=1 Tax=Danxiaibacter flavus TaxID=3049108 RepID=A0ABV3ZLE6_9BACT|nr:methyltransferase [Chitinophagaceae bacterium DXS]